MFSAKGAAQASAWGSAPGIQSSMNAALMDSAIHKSWDAVPGFEMSGARL